MKSNTKFSFFFVFVFSDNTTDDKRERDRGKETDKKFCINFGFWETAHLPPPPPPFPNMTVQSDRNIALKDIDKKSKYKDLELEIQRMWHTKTVVIPVVVGALGTVKKGMVENIKGVSEAATVTEIQKICMLGSTRILRKVLSV